MKEENNKHTHIQYVLYAEYVQYANSIIGVHIYAWYVKYAIICKICDNDFSYEHPSFWYEPPPFSYAQYTKYAK